MLQLPRLRCCLVGYVALPSRAEAQCSYVSLVVASFLIISSKQKKLVLENIVSFPLRQWGQNLIEREKFWIENKERVKVRKFLVSSNVTA